MSAHRIVLVVGIEADQPFGDAGRRLTEAVLSDWKYELEHALAVFARPEAWGNAGNGNVRVFAEIRQEDQDG